MAILRVDRREKKRALAATLRIRSDTDAASVNVKSL